MSDVISGAIATVLLKIIGIGLSYFFLAYLTNMLGADVAGIFSLSVYALLILTALGTLGFPIALLRFSAQYGLQNRWANLKRIYVRMAVSSSLVSLLIGVIVYVLSNALAELFLKDAGLSPVFKIIAFAIPFSSLSAINVEAIRGLQKIRASEFIRSVNLGFWSLLFFILLNQFVGYNATNPVMAYTLSVFLTFCISTLHWRSLMANRISTKLEEPHMRISDILRISAPMLLTVLMQFIIEAFGVIILGFFRNPREVGIYAVALKLSTVTGFILVAINTIAGPKFAELYWSDKKADLNNIISFTSRIIFWTSAPVLISFVVFPGFFMGLFGAEFIAGKQALIILSVGQFFNAACGSVGSFLLMTGGQKAFSNFLMIGALLNVVLSIGLVKTMGIIGAAYSSVASVICWNILSLIHIKVKYHIDTFYVPFVRKRSFSVSDI